MSWRVLLALLPLGVATLLVLLIANDQLANPLLYAQADLAVLLLSAGTLCSSLLLAVLVARRRGARQRDAISGAAFAHAAADRQRFLRLLDHELRNPLTAIQVGIANVAQLADEGERQAEIETTMAELRRLSRLTANLRKLAAIETQQLDLTPIDISLLLEEVIGLAREQPEAAERTLALVLPRVPWPVPPVRGDQDLLFLAIYNIVENALKFTGPGDTIELRAAEDGTAVVIEVADTGMGIPEADLALVWEELYRGENGAAAPGSGLGLALVRAILTRHGGDVQLRSRQGQGSLVLLRLPIS
jgi:two-component system, OmpR family, sensor kinase